MASLDLLLANLLSPVVLAFALGVLARVVRSDLEFPAPLYDALSIYLLLAIGLKGGAELSVTPLLEFAAPAGLTLALGVVTPLIAYGILRKLGRFDRTNAAAVAAHYGSVSAVTFIAATAFAQRAGLAPEGFMPALVALLEVPAIVVALMIAHVRSGAAGTWGEALHEIMAGRSVVLLLGGLAIGWLAGKEGIAPVAPFFVEGFQGALTLFLLEMGMAAAARLRDLRRVGVFLVIFGVVLPILHGALAIWLGGLVGLSPGGSAVFGAMVSSASYIAAPAAVRIALPQASPTLYLTASLGITFPFNLTLGIPLYYDLAIRLAG
ncbi:MAG TPA: sodium-dependent bicarbonate transport family permease [Candidatus Krumholzibacteria bacterium]|nr:sodium-dependent bicarbonate transport family permease [Candidatus Krumholzibacteria bacterium]